MPRSVILLFGALTVIMLLILGMMVAIATGLYVPPGMTPAEPAEEPRAPKTDLAEADYVKLEPEMTVDLPNAEPARYLEAEVEIASTSEEVTQALERHEAAIRDELMLMLSEQSFSRLNDVEGRDELRKEALQIVNSVLEEHNVEGKAQELYFTRMVAQ